MTLDVRTDRTLVRSATRSDRYVHVRFAAPEAKTAVERPPVDVAFVLDRSGSMAGEKLLLAKEAVRQALGMLGERDAFALVVYDHSVEVLAERTAATPDAVRAAIERLALVEPGGTTALCDGWERGLQLLEGRRAGGIARILLLTDGLANVGTTDPGALEGLAGQARRGGIATSTFGVGADFDEDLLRRMAEAGGGHFWFIERPEQIPDLVTSELGEVLEIVARDVALVVEGPDALEVEALTPIRSGSGPRRFLLGDLVSAQEVEVLVRVRFPQGADGEAVVLALRLEDSDATLDGTPREVWWEYADHAANDAQARDRDVDRMVARTYAARARREALIFNRDGRFDRARAILGAVARGIAGYAGDDAELLALVDALSREAEELASYRIADMDRKRRYSMVESQLNVRDAEGRARRRRP